MKTRVGLVSFGYPNFRVDLAQNTLNQTIEILKQENIELIAYESVITEVSQTSEMIEKLNQQMVDMIIIQNGTFSDGNHIIKIAEKMSEVPILLWAFPEPKAGECNYIARNSMTAFNMFTSFLHKLQIPFQYVFGNVENIATVQKVKNHIQAIGIKKKLRNATFCIVGGRAPGFYLSSVDELRYRKEIGPEIIYYSIAQLVEDAKQIDKDLVEKEVNKMNQLASTITTTKEAVEKSCRVYLALMNFKKANKVDAFTIKCWPEMQTLYHFAPCGVLSRMNSEGIMVSCEGDIPGLTTMYIEHLFTNQAVFFADMVNINENGTMKLWHCGCAPYQLACEQSQIALSEHPTIKNGIGMAVEFEMNKGRIVMCKVKEGAKGYQLFMAPGEAVTPDRMLTGNQIDIRFDRSSEEVLQTIVENGIEHHYGIVFEDILDKMECLCKWMNIEVIACK